MLLTELFDNRSASPSTIGTTDTTGTNKPKTAKELNDERNAKRKADIEKRKNAMKARAHQNGQRPENKSDTDEAVDND